MGAPAATMELLVRQSRRIGWVSLVILPGAWLCFGVHSMVGVGSGILWALANAVVTAKLITGGFNGSYLPWWRSAVLWVLKMPVLYGLVVLCVVSPWGSPIGFLVGFSLWFAVLIAPAIRPRTS